MSDPHNAVENVPPLPPGEDDDQPHLREGPATEAETGFTRQPMVPWLDPRQLAATAVRAALSDVFGSYADRRETLAALRKPTVYADYDTSQDRQELWIDYVADLGDGFDSSYMMAYLLGREGLDLPMHNRPPRKDDPAPHATKRGRILVMGGDQVYPTASRDEYQNRMSGPYRAALPCVDEKQERPPHLFAIPGNHDWYDGLTAFTRLFCQDRWIGGWLTRQQHSYWALKLPHGWWMLGTDIQLHADIDRPQTDYFRDLALNGMKEGDKVILCTAEPAWVHTPGNKTAFDNLAYFEETVLAGRAQVALTLTGDLHHFAHYAQEDAPGREQPKPEPGQRHKITAGGGGAYLYGTDTQPEELTLRDAKDGSTKRWVRKEVYPDLHTSFALRRGAMKGVFKTPWFLVLLGVVYGLYVWGFQNTSLRLTSPWDDVVGVDWMKRAIYPSGSLWESLVDAAWLLVRTPASMVFTLLLLVGTVAFCAPDDVRDKTRASQRRWIVGLSHGMIHVLAAMVLGYFLTLLVNTVFPDLTGPQDPFSGGRVLAVVLLTGLIGAAVGGVIFGLFLLPGVNLNEAFSSQAIGDYKNFVRLKVSSNGDLTVYPVGVEKAVKWKFRAKAPVGQAWYVPDGEAPRPHLLEEPFVIPGPKHVKVDRIVAGEPATADAFPTAVNSQITDSVS